ncbi:MAG: Gfo/Idh/MocA family oxidoreductase [Litorilinea sp.]
MPQNQEKSTSPNQSGDQPVRVGIIGAGIFARDAHAPSLLRLPEHLQVVAVYSRTATRAEALAEQFPPVDGAPVQVYTELDALLADPQVDAVDIILPIGNLADAVERALKAGKHVLSEKPIAPDPATAQQLLAVAARHPDQVWMVGENWRYEEAFIEAGNLIRAGRIGTPILCQWTLHAPITDSNKYYHTAWRRNESFPGGFLLDGGVHQAAALRLVMGEVSEVTATVHQTRADLPPADTLSATLRFANGALGSLAVTYAAPAPWESWLCVTGSDGALRVQRDALELTVDGKTERQEFTGINGVELELAAFAQAIRHGTPHVNTPAAGLADLELVSGMLLAAESGARVQL